MDIKLLLFSCVFIAVGAEDCSANPVVNVYSNGGCCNDGFPSVFEDTLLRNVSKILEDHVTNIEKICEKNPSLSKETTMKPRDCQDIQDQGYKSSGIYNIYPDGTNGFSVRCDMDTDGGGWTVFQRRLSKSDFYKSWIEYQFGFGNLSENFWLGNHQIYTIASQGWYMLRVDLGSKDGETAYAEYKLFRLGDVVTKYQLTIDGYNGNASDSLAYHNGRKFSTKDQDNDEYDGECVQRYKGGWWYGVCHQSNLNGEYGSTIEAVGPVWLHWKGHQVPLPKTEMKIRRYQNTVTDISFNGYDNKKRLTELK